MYARRFRSFDWAFAVLGAAAVLSPFVLKAEPERQALQAGAEHERRLAAGGSCTALGQPKEALELYRQALARFEELADEAGQAAAWSGIGLSHTALGDTAAAISDQRRALSLRRGLGDLYEEGKALNNLGFAVHRQGELREAQGFYEQAQEAFERAGENGWWKAAVLHNLAAIYIDLGEPEAALRSQVRASLLSLPLAQPHR